MKSELRTILERRIDAEFDSRRPALSDRYQATRSRMSARGMLRSSIAGKAVAELCVDELNARGEAIWKLTRDSLARAKAPFDQETCDQTKALVRKKLPPDLPDLYSLINESMKGFPNDSFVRQISKILQTAYANLLARLDAEIDLETLGSSFNEATKEAPLNSDEFDVFISHASEDKEGLVRPLAQAMTKAGIRVWYDEYTLTWGDRLRRSIDRGLASSKYGIVVLSPSFFSKEWPQRELDGLTALELEDGRKRILPVWHKIKAAGIKQHSPTLGDVIGISTEIGIESIVDELVAKLRG